MPSVGEPSGEGVMLSVAEGGLWKDSVVEAGDPFRTWSDSAVVAIAFAVPDVPAKGIRPPENDILEELDCLEAARDPGRKPPRRLGLVLWPRP